MIHPRLPALLARSLLFAAVLTAAPAAFAANATPPNILFIFADDQRADTIAALGNAHIQTPNLDRLVRRGVSFNRAYMMGGMNAATCVPSRAMLLSGRSLFHIDQALTRDETWPAAFGRAGYTTFISGKWHNTPAAVPLSFQRARQLFTGGMTNPLKAPLADLENGKMGPTKVSPKHACEVFADETIAFLKEKHTAPFFAYLAFDGPHDPHIVPDDYPVRYDPEKIPLPADFLAQHPFDNGEMTIRDEQLLPWPRTSADIRSMLADYYRYISYLDLPGSPAAATASSANKTSTNTPCAYHSSSPAPAFPQTSAPTRCATSSTSSPRSVHSAASPAQKPARASTSAPRCATPRRPPAPRSCSPTRKSNAVSATSATNSSATRRSTVPNSLTSSPTPLNAPTSPPVPSTPHGSPR